MRKQSNIRWTLLTHAAGVLSGIAAYQLAQWAFDVRAHIGVMPMWSWSAALVSVAAWVSAGRIISPPWHRWARTATLCSTVLLGLFAMANWTGHAGNGRWEAVRMYGHLMWFGEAIPTADASLVDLNAQLARYREETNAYFGDGAVTLTPDGWAATLESPHSGRICAIYRGSTAPWPALREGRARCKLPPPWGRLALWLALFWTGPLAVVAAVPRDESALWGGVV